MLPPEQPCTSRHTHHPAQLGCDDPGPSSITTAPPTPSTRPSKRSPSSSPPCARACLLLLPPRRMTDPRDNAVMSLPRPRSTAHVASWRPRARPCKALISAGCVLSLPSSSSSVLCSAKRFFSSTCLLRTLVLHQRARRQAPATSIPSYRA